MAPTSPEVEVMFTKLPLCCLRKWSAAWRQALNAPFSMTLITESQSSSIILWKMTSRRMPALLTTQSMRPKESRAHWMIFAAEANSATLSKLETAWPPAFLISETTASASACSRLSPSSDAPMSCTTTLAPCAAMSFAIAAPMPRPAPVTTTTLPPTILPGLTFLLLYKTVSPQRHRVYRGYESTNLILEDLCGLWVSVVNQRSQRGRCSAPSLRARERWSGTRRHCRHATSRYGWSRPGISARQTV